MAALKKAHTRKPAETESWMSKTQLEDLRRIERERIEGAKMKTMGFGDHVKSSSGVGFICFLLQ